MRLITKSLKRIDRSAPARSGGEPPVPRDPCRRRTRPRPCSGTMNEAGVLGRFVPDFGRIVAMMQFNMYHHYTVDEHLIRAIGTLSALQAGRISDEHPLSIQHPADDQGSDGALCRAVSPRHRQGPARGPFARRRPRGAPALSALRPDAPADRDRRLARRAAPHDVDDRPVARPVRPPHHHRTSPRSCRRWSG